jgi:anti-sigma B factor antagonist
MKLHESRQRNVDIFHLEDEIDLHYAPSLRARFQAKASQRCPALVVDLSGVPFIDSTGIAVLLEYLRDASGFGGKFCIAGPTDHVRHVFEIVKLEKSLPVFDSTAAAIAAIRHDDLPAPVPPLFSVTSESSPARRAA